MINITVTAKELPGVIEILKKEGLLNQLINRPEQPGTAQPMPTQPLPAQPVKTEYQSPEQFTQPCQPMVNVSPAQPLPTQPLPTMPVNNQPMPVFNQGFPVNNFAPIPGVMPQQIPAQTVPTAIKNYTIEELSLTATRELLDTGRGVELRQLLTRYGVAENQGLTSLNPQYYGSFATDLRTLGCHI